MTRIGSIGGICRHLKIKMVALTSTLTARYMDIVRDPTTNTGQKLAEGLCEVLDKRFVGVKAEGFGDVDRPTSYFSNNK
ncbi:pro-pol protein [Moniliophthora roreri]|nr:pro-pol protein [Moniliophthora roreri]